VVDRPTYPGLRRDGSSPLAEVALVVNSQLRGAVNWVYDVPIEAGADHAVLTSDAIHPYQLLLAEPGTSITGHTIATNVLMLSVTPGPARFERIGLVG
jgi:hypothetical protein